MLDLNDPKDAVLLEALVMQYSLVDLILRPVWCRNRLTLEEAKAVAPENNLPKHYADHLKEKREVKC